MKILAALLMVTTLPVTAKEPKRSVAITCDCQDAIGKAYKMKLRSALRNSSDFNLIDVDISKNTPVSIWVLRISTSVSDDPLLSSHLDMIGIALTAGPIYLNHWVQTCGKAVIQTCSENTLKELEFNHQEALRIR